MSVKVVAVTQPLISNNGAVLTPDEFIVYCARVSNPNNQLNTLTSAGLINYCIKHQHWSIFEQASMTLEIKTSRAIAAQILRHKSFSFQEFSQRYAEVTSVEKIELRRQAEKNRQSSTEVITDPELLEEVSKMVDYSFACYNKLIKAGVAKESARFVLPLAASTTLYMTGSIRSWIHYILLRTKEDTQKEHAIIAKEAKQAMAEYFPTVTAAIDAG